MLDEQSMILHFSFCNFLTLRHYRSRCRSRWENLDRGQYPFQPIKFVNLGVPSPFETEPYNKTKLLINLQINQPIQNECLFIFLNTKSTKLLHYNSASQSFIYIHLLGDIGPPSRQWSDTCKKMTNNKIIVNWTHRNIVMVF